MLFYGPATESDQKPDLATTDAMNAAARVAALRERVGLSVDVIGLGHTFPCDRPALHTRLEPDMFARASDLYDLRRERMALMINEGVLGGVEASSRKRHADEQCVAALWRRRALTHVEKVSEADAIVIAGDDPVDVAVRIDILEALYARDHPDDRKHRLMVFTTTPIVVIDTVTSALATVTIRDFVAWIEDGARAEMLVA